MENTLPIIYETIAKIANQMVWVVGHPDSEEIIDRFFDVVQKDTLACIESQRTALKALNASIKR